jgi:G3E family GTPase
MKTRYIVALVALAVAITAAVIFVIYKNWGAIKGLYTKSKDAVKNKFKKVQPLPVKKVGPTEILAKVQEDPVMVQDLVELNKTDLAAKQNALDITQKAQQVVKQEATIKKSQGMSIASTITLATKYRKIADEKEASKKYNEILKKIETEKAKGAVLLSAVRAEQLKTDKLKIMDSLDMEDEYAMNMKIKSPISHVVTKRDAELFVKNHMDSV